MAKEFRVAIAAPNGDVANPSFTFASDPDTGMYRAASNVLGLMAGENTNLFVDSVGVRVYNGLRVLFGNLRVEGGYDIKVNDGVQDLDVLLDMPTRTLFTGRPGTVTATTPSPAIVERYRPASGVTAIVTNITMSYPAAGGSPLLVGLKPASVGATFFSYWKPVGANQTLSIDTFIPMGSTDCLVAGELLSNTVDFQSTATVTISGVEVR